jgi:hypothetical protein
MSAHIAVNALAVIRTESLRPPFCRLEYEARRARLGTVTSQLLALELLPANFDILLGGIARKDEVRQKICTDQGRID